jgi:hypothetical protein
MSIQTNDFLSNSLSGTVLVTESKILIELPTVKIPFNGNKQFVVKIRRNSVIGPVVTTSPQITLRDYSELISITPNTLITSEGTIVGFTVVTANVDNNSNLYFSLSGNVSPEDFITSNTGIITIVNNIGYANVTTNADLTSYFEGTEQFVLQLRKDSSTGTVIGNSNLVLVLDTSNIFTLDSVSVSSSNIFESESVIITVNSFNGFGNAAGTYYYTLTGNATVFGNTSGSIIINDNQGTAEVILESDVPSTEVRLLDVQIRETSVSGTILGNSGNIRVNPFITGTAPNAKVSLIRTLSSNVAAIGKGQSVVFTANTIGATQGETLYYDTIAVGNGLITSGTFVSGNTGSFTVNGNIGTITLTANTTGDYDDTFRLRVRRNSINGTVLGQSNVITYSGEPSLDILSISTSNLYETQALTLNITTSNASNSYTLYYTTSGNADIFGSNSGSISVVNNTANLELIAEASIPPNQTRNFAIQIRKDSITGDILSTTGNITVRDIDTFTTSNANINATGGNVETYGDYRIHIFESSGSFVVNTLTANTLANTVEYLIVAGGGAGGQSSYGAGGGGAGGVLLGNILISSTGTYPVTIGGGGSGTNGTNTTAFSQVAKGGGKGGASSTAGSSGGSGGGGSNDNGGPGAAIGFPGPSAQGYPGGLAKGSGIGNASAGGGGGAGEAGITPVLNTSGGGRGGHGIAIPWAPSTLGSNVAQTFPAPGRGANGGTRFFAGGGGSGSEQLGIASPGGFGGGGAGNPSTNGAPLAQLAAQAAIVNTGGGGGGGGHASGAPGAGGSGIVLVRYPIVKIGQFARRISYVTSVSTGANSHYIDDTVTVQVTTQNVIENEVLYYNIAGSANSEIVGGNTGSFTVTSNNNVSLPITFNYPSSSSANVRIEILRNLNGALLATTPNIYIRPREVLGGLVIDEGTAIVHVFLESSNITVTSSGANINANVLLVAGGGSGTGYMAGGGGGGGMLEVPVTLQEGQYTLIVGAGAAGSGAGSNSSGFGTTVVGGGRGAINPGLPGTPGGSGGGGGGSNGGGLPAGTGIPGQGNPGSTNISPLSGGNGYSGAGGGAGGAGGPGPSFAGGTGRSSLISPVNYGTNPSNASTPGGIRYFAGGGGGSAGPTGSVGGLGGGAATKQNGLVNTGGGGGGNPWQSPVSTSGGSGIIIVRYPKP